MTSNSVFIVTNSYQGVHMVSSTEALAQEYVDTKVSEAPKGSCWERHHFQIFEQPLDAHPVWDQWGD